MLDDDDGQFVVSTMKEHTSSRSLRRPIQAIPMNGKEAVTPMKAVQPRNVYSLLLSFLPALCPPEPAGPACCFDLTWRFSSLAMYGGIFFAPDIV